MASPDPPDKSGRGPPHAGDENPFITFRHYADQQMAALFQGIVGFPSTFDWPNWSPNWAPSWVHEAEERLRRAEDARKQTDMGGEDDGRRPCSRGWWGSTRRSSCHQARDRQPPCQRAELDPTSSMNAAAPGLEAFVTPLSAPMSLYLLDSPYSPLQLEAHPNQALARPGNDPAYWRAAFEDLLVHASGPYQRPYSSPTDVRDSEWALALPAAWAAALSPESKRHALGWTAGRREFELHPFGSGHGSWLDLWRSFGALDRLARDDLDTAELPGEDVRDHGASDSEPQTELDMYEQFLDQLRPAGGRAHDETSEPQPEPQPEPQTEQQETPSAKAQSHSSPWEQLMSGQDQTSAQKRRVQPALDSDSGSFKKDGVVATLTTTEHVVLPDGSTRTTVSLRKRFEDGREERKETVHTSHGSERVQRDEAEKKPSWSDGAKPRELEAGNADAPSPRRKPKGGWFWS